MHGNQETTIMSKMLLLDGPSAGSVKDFHGGLPVPIQVSIENHSSAHKTYANIIAYTPMKIILFGRIMYVGVCGAYDDQDLNTLAFEILMSDTAKGIVAEVR
jgi:hypothetical protein